LRMQDLGGLPLVLMLAKSCLRKMMEASAQRRRSRPKSCARWTSPWASFRRWREGQDL